jgi:hypothetical protein
MGGLEPVDFLLKYAVGSAWAATNAGFRGQIDVFAEKMAVLGWQAD